MGRRRKRGWSLKWCSFFASIAVMALMKPVNADVETSSEDDATCDDDHDVLSNHSKYAGDLILVSTLDGKMTALNPTGHIVWSLDTSTPLLSSSIDKMEIINENGVAIRLIPSLDGGLYSWDGETVQALPFTSESLLSSSFKLMDDSMIVGGKETKSYGINASTGQLRYICSGDGCQTFGDSNKDDDIIMVKREQQTVRSVEQRTGGEKWNFSVGQHEVSFLKGIHSNKDNAWKYCDDSEEGCQISDEERDFFFSEDDDYRMDPDLKFVVSDGSVAAVSRQNSQKVLWKQKLSSPISSAWTLEDGEVMNVNLFEADNIPALTMGEHAMGTDRESANELQEYMQPMLYMGTYNNHIYIQQSHTMNRDVQQAAQSVAMLDDNMRMIAGPRVQWRPYIASAPSRTPAMITHVMEGTEDAGKALATWSQYPFDSGYYLFADQSPVNLMTDGGGKREPLVISEANNESYEGYSMNILIAVSIWDWWKELLQGCILMSILFDIGKKKLTGSNTSITPPITKTPERDGAFISRYQEDFDQLLCLGKGGFGTVFQAKNKLDDNMYAVKRISLPDREEARKKKKVPTATLR